MSLRRPEHRALLTVAALAAVLALDTEAGATSRAPAGEHGRPALSYSSAAAFLRATIEDKVSGEWEEAWRSLYPPHQRIAPHDVYVRCETATPFAAPLESLRIVRVRAAAVYVPGRRGTLPGVAIDVVVGLSWYGPRDPIVFRHTFHLVAVRGGWTWLLSPSRYRLYAEGVCGADPRFTASLRAGRASTPVTARGS